MKFFFSGVILLLITASCNLHQKAKDAVHKTGETVAEAGSEFVDGVSKGIEKSFSNKAELSTDLQKKGLHTGKISIVSSDSASDNILRVYFIFDSSFNQAITVKAFTSAGDEYGRVKQNVSGNTADARYTDFVFDKRTNLDGKSRFTFE